MQHESVKWDRDRDSADDAPRQQAMGQGIKPAQRKAPTQDQKRVRREMARKTADLEIVAFDPAHTSVQPDGSRVCNTCQEPVTIKRTDRGMAAVHTSTGQGSCSARKGSPAKDWDGASLSAGGDSSMAASASFHLADIEQAGDRTCMACGHYGPPVLGDTGPVCNQCGSYSLKQAEFKHPYAPRGASLHTTATQIETNIASADGRVLLNAGDAIRLPSGQTTRVRNVRRHETSGDHYYVDTDMGTTVMPYSTKVQVVPSDTRQQGLPSYGDPRANSNQLPGHSQNSGIATTAPSVCPVCGGKAMSPVAGGKHRCSRCGFTQSAQGNMSFSDHTQQIAQPRQASLAPQTAVGKRAAEVLELMKETPL